MPHLVVREPGSVAITVALQNELTVGRGPENGLIIADRQASRKHVGFSLAAAGWQAKDLGSTHGTLINRKPIVDPHTLVDGDVIQIGNVLIVFRDGDLTDERSIVHSFTSAELAARPRKSQDARRLQLLYEVSRAMGLPAAGGDPEALMARMLDATLDELGCERGVIGLGDGASSTTRRVTRGAAGGPGEDIVVSRTLIDRVLKLGESILVDTSAPETAITVVREGVKSAMAAPLQGARRILGFVYVDDRERRDRFAPPELEFLTALARLAAASLEHLEEQRRTSAVVEALREANPIPEIIGQSEPMNRLRGLVQKYAAAAHSAVLIRGESGTGKELVATTIHALSARAAQPFVTVNCAAIPDTLIESELFGHEKGAFTGAVKPRRGKFVMAHKGTLFLDEIGDLSLVAQAKVLRAIQEGEVQPLGAEKTIQVDVRVISATHKALTEEIAAKRFREDLFYRLSVGEVELPPLRSRGQDVVILARAYLQRAAKRVGKHVDDFSPAAIEALCRYGWPGNVRQLQNEIERAVILAEGPVLELEELRSRVASAAPASGPVDTHSTLAERFTQLDVTERQLVESALDQTQGRVSEAARLLGISRIMLRRRIERFGLGGSEPE